MNDKCEKERQTRGEEVCTSKITELQVIEMRELYKSGMTQKQLSQMFGISRSSVSDILNYITWKHVA
jgi:DNA-binding transcriptional regulator LsrR (DeoR family)